MYLPYEPFVGVALQGTPDRRPRGISGEAELERSGYRGTTIVAVRHQGRVALGGDGQVTLGDTVVKAGAHKVRRLKDGRILAGFAGSVADAFTLFEKFEEKLERYPGNLPRASVELAKDWRTDRYLRRLEAALAVADRAHLFLISGDGNVIEPDDEVISIGSGSGYALAAARALRMHSSLSAADIVRKSLEIAADICIYTNREITVLELDGSDEQAGLAGQIGS